VDIDAPGPGEAGSTDRDVDGHWWLDGRRGVIFDALTHLPRGHSISDIAVIGPAATALVPDLHAAFRDAVVSVVAQGGAPDRLDAASGSLDLVVAIELLESCEDDDAMLGELFRILRRGGSLVVTAHAMPSLRSSIDRAQGGTRRYRRPRLMGVAQRAGFRVLRCTYFDSLLLSAAYARRTMPELLRRDALDPHRTPGPLASSVGRVAFRAERRYLKHGRMPLGAQLLLVAIHP